MKIIIKPIFVLSLLILSGCAGPKTNLFPPDENDKTVSIYLTDHGRHIGLVVPVNSISTNIWPEAKDFKSNNFIEAGWGDEDYFITPDPSFWMATKALLWPTSSAILIVGFDKPPKEYFLKSGITKINLSEIGTVVRKKIED